MMCINCGTRNGYQTHITGKIPLTIGMEPCTDFSTVPLTAAISIALPPFVVPLFGISLTDFVQIFIDP